jgi:hypothetical protein
MLSADYTKSCISLQQARLKISVAPVFVFHPKSSANPTLDVIATLVVLYVVYMRVLA